MKLPIRSLPAWLGFVVAASGLLSAAARGHAEEVKITIVVILASDRNHVVDRELQGIADEVRKCYPHLTGFRLGQITQKSLPVGKSEKFALVEDEVATVLVRHAADSKNRVGLTVKAPLQGEIQYSTCCGKFFPIVTRYQTKAKELLILAIRVQPCKKEPQ
ncbi:MAG TPA: hypothetical protein VKU02_08800 [Gemmataceae bacterium]|nr:hypothetical protein [Gemmataceae bacterium]